MTLQSSLRFAAWAQLGIAVLCGYFIAGLPLDASPAESLRRVNLGTTALLALVFARGLWARSPIGVIGAPVVAFLVAIPGVVGWLPVLRQFRAAQQLPGAMPSGTLGTLILTGVFVGLQVAVLALCLANAAWRRSFRAP